MAQKRSLLIDFPKMVRTAKDRFKLDLRGIHGVSHWQRVRENGHRIAKRTGVEAVLVDLFAYLHDCCREDDRSDPGHGERAAVFVQSLRGSMFELEDATFEVSKLFATMSWEWLAGISSSEHVGMRID